MFAAVGTNKLSNNDSDEMVHEITIHSLESFGVVNQFEGPGRVNNLCFNSTFTRLTCSLEDGSVRLWDLVDCSSTVISFPVVDWGIKALCFKRHSNSLFIKRDASEERDCDSAPFVIELWNLDNMAVEFSVKSVVGSPSTLLVSADDKFLYGVNDCEYTSYLFAWDASNGNEMARCDLTHIYSMALHDNTNRLAISGSNSVWIRDASTLELQQQITFGEYDWVYYVQFSSNGERLATLIGAQLNLYDVASGTVVQQFLEDIDWAEVFIKEFVFSHDDAQLFVLSNKSIMVFDCGSGECVREIPCGSGVAAFHESRQVVLL